jgi:N-hydroxyarylamine O-acetyltransferase
MSLVEIAGRSWLIDVGFGAGGLRTPMPLEPGRIEQGPGWAFRFVDREPWGTMMQSQENGVWLDSYSFDLSPVTAADIAVGNHFTATAAASHFVTSRIASLPRPDGRVSMRDFTLTELRAGRKTTREVAPGPAYLAELVTNFGIDLAVDYDELRDLGS